MVRAALKAWGMANISKRRKAIRRAYNYCCGYCGVKEEDAGSELEIDHFRPRSAGGGDEPDNLVYCCPTCNRIKGDFWPTDEQLALSHRLLHPRNDDSTAHLRQEENGRLTALTEIGAFHLTRLRLNRPPLVALRRTRRENLLIRQNLEYTRNENAQLREQMALVGREIKRVLDWLSRLLEP
ncbi:MAG: HNH endonuclease [Blastocatellia bacterium]|nr:HNH endonuclease [Blastocatellia bacterium]